MLKSSPVDSLRYLRQGPYAFTIRSIESLPEKSGIFVLYNEESCVLVGKTKNLRSKLAELAAEPDECLKQHSPTFLEIEPCSPFKIGTRWAVLKQGLEVRGIRPLCNAQL